MMRLPQISMILFSPKWLDQIKLLHDTGWQWQWRTDESSQY